MTEINSFGNLISFYLQCRGLYSSISRGFAVQSLIALEQNTDTLLIRGKADTGAWTQAWRLKPLTGSGISTGSAHHSAALTFCSMAPAFPGEQCHLKAIGCSCVQPFLIEGTKNCHSVIQMMRAGV